MRYYYTAFGVVVVSIIAIVILISNSGSGKKPASTTATTKKPATVKLLDYEEKDAKLILTVQGKLVGEDQRKSIRISVSPDERVIEVLDGYYEATEKSQRYNNNQAAYQTFLRALNLAGFTRSRPAGTTDERGMCATGSTYIYDVESAGETKSHLWSTSCTTAQGTLVPGTAPYIRQLFQSQITDYNKFTEGVQL